VKAAVVVMPVVVVVVCGTWLNSENNRTSHGTCELHCAFRSFTTQHTCYSVILRRFPKNVFLFYRFFLTKTVLNKIQGSHGSTTAKWNLGCHTKDSEATRRESRIAGTA
jgi:ABC-type arginine transport system permease subunit